MFVHKTLRCLVYAKMNFYCYLRLKSNSRLISQVKKTYKDLFLFVFGNFVVLMDVIVNRPPVNVQHQIYT